MRSVTPIERRSARTWSAHAFCDVWCTFADDDAALFHLENCFWFSRPKITAVRWNVRVPHTPMGEVKYHRDERYYTARLPDQRSRLHE